MDRQEDEAMRLLKKIAAIVIAIILAGVAMPVTTWAADASMSFGIGRMFDSSSFQKVNVIDFGTIDFSQRVFTAEKPILIKNESGSATIDIGVVYDYNNTIRVFPFSDTYSNAAWPPSHSLSGNNSFADDVVYLDATYLPAGTYTGEFYIRPTKGETLNINGGAIKANAEGDYIIPITVTLTGQNPNLAGQVQNLKAKAGNHVVELSWDELEYWGEDEGIGSYTLYRMTGTAQGAPGNGTTDPWEILQEDLNGTLTEYVDYSAENGTTYSYTIVAGSIGHGYCSEPVTVTPGEEHISRPMPIELGAYDTLDGVGLSWEMEVQDWNASCEDIDHFNVYRNGILCAQVDVSAYSRDYVSYYNPSQESYVTDYYYKWDITIPSDPGVLYDWQISIVNNEGIEGYRSEAIPAMQIDTTPYIDRYEAVFITDYQTPEDELNDTERNAVQIYVNENSVYYGIKYIEVWRDGTYIGQLKGPLVNVGMTVYDANDIQENKTYTYQIRVTDNLDQVSEKKTFYLTTDDEIGATYSVYVTYDLINGDTPSFRFFGNDGAVYGLYRNDSLVQTITGKDGTILMKDQPDTDGTYTYYLSMTENGYTTYSCAYRYERNTVPAAAGEKPSAPVLKARIIGEGQVSLKWTPTAGGGPADGYYVYKVHTYDGEEQYRTDKFSESDGYWSGLYGSEDPQNRYIRLYADKTSFVDQSYMNWNYAEQFPVKYWVCAYNQYGVSEPSEVIVYEYSDGSVPENSNLEAPGKPLITKIWDERHANTTDAYAEIYRDLCVTWEPPADGGEADSFEIRIQKKNSQGEYEDESISSNTTNDWCSFSGDRNLDPAYDGNNDVGIYKITVIAVNQVNGVTYRTSSDPVYYELSYRPMLSLSAGLDHVTLSWTDSTSGTSADDYEIWRRSEYGLWEKLAVSPSKITYDSSAKAFSYTDSAVTTGTTYQYYVLRKSEVGGRKSAEQTISTTDKSILPGAPSSLTAKRIDGDKMVVSWNAPTTGGTPTGYIIQYYYDYSDGAKWEDVRIINTPTTAYAGYISSDRIRVVAFNDGGKGPASEEIKTSDLPENVSSYYPFYVVPEISSGDATITLTWKKAASSAEWGEADYYEILRSKNDGEKASVAIVPAVEGQSSYSWTDPDVENGNTYEYWLHATNSRGYYPSNAGYGGLLEYSVWATPEGSSMNSDQKAALAVEQLISQLPEAGSFDTSDNAVVSKVREIYALYAGMTDVQKAGIDASERQKIETLMAKVEYADAEAKYENNSNVANARALIAALPDAADITSTSLNDALLAQIDEAREAYARLPEDAKLVVDTEKLDAAERKIVILQQQEADKEAIRKVITAIAALPDPDEVTPDNMAAVLLQVERVQVLQNSLTPNQKQGMQNMAEGAAALDKLNKLLVALGQLHNLEKTDAVDATCTSDGHIAYWTCKDCGKIFRDAEGKKEITLAQTVIGKLGHAYENVAGSAIAATCTTDGKEADQKCSRCGDLIEGAVIGKLGHDWGEWTVSVPATTTSEGEQIRTCNRCGEEEKGIIPMVGLEFDDVRNPNAWYYATVYTIAKTTNANGKPLMSGYGNSNNFGPADPLTRQDFAVILYRFADEPEVEEMENPFKDTKENGYYYTCVLWAKANSVIAGYNDGRFGVGDKITREQVATILYRFAKDYLHLNTSEKGDLSKFEDGKAISSWAEEALTWAIGAGIITGKANGTKIDARGNAARAEIAAMILRFIAYIDQ